MSVALTAQSLPGRHGVCLLRYLESVPPHNFRFSTVSIAPDFSSPATRTSESVRPLRSRPPSCHRDDGAVAGDGARRLPRARGGQEAEAASRLMDGLSIFGLLSVSAMLLFYALEPRGPHCVLAFAAACALSGA